MENNEELNNFMHKVNKVTTIINQLMSENKETAQNAQLQADEYLNEKNKLDTDENVDIKLKYDKSVINKIPCDNEKKMTRPNEMDPDAFMKYVSMDAENRAADKKVRIERAETLKTQAAKAFKRGEYELALSRYNKAIEQIRDSCLLYTNRALTLLKLKQHDKVISDCEWALKLNSNSFKAKLYRSKAYKELENNEKYIELYSELIKEYPQYKELIDDFLQPQLVKNNEDEV